MNLFVINLKSSKVRRKRMAGQLAALDIAFEFFEAIDGRLHNHPLFELYDDSKRRFYRGRNLSEGELGAFASHFLLWERCVQLGQPIVVLEDDLQLEPFFRDALSKAASCLEACKFIRLWGTKRNVRYVTRKPLGNFDFVEYLKGPAGALCYMISPEAAQTFITHAEKWYLAVDDYMDRCHLHGVPCFALKPFAVKMTDLESTIDRTFDGKKSISDRVCREIGRLLENVRRTRYRVLN